MATTYDDSDYPLVRVSVLGTSTDQEIDERIAFLQRNLERSGRVAIVFDSRVGGTLSARQRKMWTDWLGDQRALIERDCAGCAIVASPLAKAMFTGIFWVWKPPMPVRFCSTVQEADAWAQRQLAV